MPLIQPAHPAVQSEFSRPAEEGRMSRMVVEQQQNEQPTFDSFLSS